MTKWVVIWLSVLAVTLCLLSVSASGRTNSGIAWISSECHKGFLFAWSGSGYGGQRYIVQVMGRTGDGLLTPIRCKEED